MHWPIGWIAAVVALGTCSEKVNCAANECRLQLTHINNHKHWYIIYIKNTYIQYYTCIGSLVAQQNTHTHTTKY